MTENGNYKKIKQRCFFFHFLLISLHRNVADSTAPATVDRNATKIEITFIGIIVVFFSKNRNIFHSSPFASKCQRPEAVEPAGLVTSSFNLPG